ncbi:MAG: hypothetical protein VX823_09360 [Actinomycetota bacterium]|nr:hypothetical protein [Acidimicrobiales bacterium]MEC7874670.1 hypothetical protein [Actinomycetota bacterium]MEC8828868.1 hypothetical protein [Actinomycetota bacterium]MEC8923835.1 hypothetical protein [Actinomycetota bacterium]MEC9315869.1 hypothetical protein [Actinomycetota bacterium]
MLSTLHLIACWVLVIGNGVSGVWALSSARWPKLSSPQLWRFTAFVQTLVFAQVTLAAVHLNANDGPQTFHVFYGVLTATTVGILYSYRSQFRGQLHRLYGWGGLFIMGLGIRALVLL